MADTVEHRRIWRNTSAEPVRYPLGSFKVEVPAGAELVFYACEAVSDPFTRALDRRKLFGRVAPTLIVLAIVVMAALMVVYMTSHSGAAG